MHTIYITAQDNERLRRHILLSPFCSRRDPAIGSLRGELDRALIYADPAERPNALRIGTSFDYIDPQTGETGTGTLFLPGEMPWPEDGISVTSRFGAAALGCCVGDEVRWVTPMSARRVVITDVRQPPAAREDEAELQPVEGVA